MDPWMVEVLKGYFIPFSFLPSSLSGSDPFCQLFHQGESSSRGDFVSHRERGSRASSSSPGYYSCMFVVWKVSGSRRLVSLEQVCPPNKVQDGDQSVSSPSCSARRLDDLHRPEGCLSSGSRSSREQEVPSVWGF